MTYFEENIALLSARFPDFTRDVLSGAGNHDTCFRKQLEYIDTPSGYPTAKYRGRLLHSGKAPMTEALRLAEKEDLAESAYVLIAGFGLGYLPEACLIVNAHCSVIVLEPDIPLFLESLSFRSYRNLFTSPRFSLLLNVDPQVLYSVLPPHASGSIKLVKYRPLYEDHRDYFDKTERVTAAYINRREINENTLKRFGKLWVRNMFANLDVFPRVSPLKSLCGAMRGMPALVLAAGPSLDSVMPALPELLKRFVVVAVDTSLNACVLSGIHPDFLVVVDPQYWNLRHLDRLSSCGCLLVSESSTHPAVFRRHKGGVFFCGSIFPLSKFFEPVIGDLGKIGAGGSVATTAWDFARIIGCNPIVMAGLDLGFPGKATHYKGSFFEERSMSLSSRFLPVETMTFSYVHDAGPYYETNNIGGKTLTDRRLSLYKWWFENQFALYRETETLTLSPMGLRMENLRLLDICSLQQYPVIRNEIDEKIRRLSSSVSPDGKNIEMLLEKSVSALRKHLLDLKAIADKASELATALKDATERGSDQDASKTLYSELEKCDGLLLSSDIRDIAGFLVQGSARTILSSVTRSTSMSEVTDYSLLMYRELSESAEYHIKLLDAADEKKLKLFGKQSIINSG